MKLISQPDGASGVHKFTGPRESSELIDAASAQKVDEFPDVRTEALAILESQLLNYRSRSSAILDGSDEPSKPATPAITTTLPRLTRVYATGGASANHTLLSLMADVLSAPGARTSNSTQRPLSGRLQTGTAVRSASLTKRGGDGNDRRTGASETRLTLMSL